MDLPSMTVIKYKYLVQVMSILYVVCTYTMNTGSLLTLLPVHSFHARVYYVPLKLIPTCTLKISMLVFKGAYQTLSTSKVLKLNRDKCYLLFSVHASSKLPRYCYILL